MMKEVEKKLLSTAMRMLDSLPVKYAIQSHDGENWGELQVQSLPEKKGRNKSQYPHGVLSAHVRKHLENLDGNVAVIPVGEFNIDSIHSTVCSIAFSKFGAGNYTTSRCGDCVELVFWKGEDK